MLWIIGGLAVATFIFFFRDYSNIRFDQLKYVIAVSAFWIIFSDIAKKKRLINRRLHFFLDCVAYLSFYGLIVYFTGGYDGGMFFLFFLATISAPLFGTVPEVIIFLIVLSFETYFINYQYHLLRGEFLNAYDVGVILLQAVFYFIIAGVNKYFLEEIKSEEMEKRELEIKMMIECQEEVKLKTERLKLTIKKMEDMENQIKNVNVKLEEKVRGRTLELEGLKNNLEKTVKERTDELQKKVRELERFQELSVGRELKMIELKKQIEILNKNIK